ncbi:hypothetical protein JW824_13550 [bacterium]|nr:hypothetical protein [bacterium]
MHQKEEEKVKGKSRIASIFQISDYAWRHHANPWSVYTRFAAIPAMIFAVWSRVWISWLALIPVGVVIFWLAVNPFIFPAVSANHGWTARGIYGEKLWLFHRSRVSRGHRIILRLLIILGLAGFILMGWGLVRLRLWPTVFGATLVTVAQLWRIDRMGLLYEEMERTGSVEMDG